MNRHPNEQRITEYVKRHIEETFNSFIGSSSSFDAMKALMNGVAASVHCAMGRLKQDTIINDFDVDVYITDDQIISRRVIRGARPGDMTPDLGIVIAVDAENECTILQRKSKSSNGSLVVNVRCRPFAAIDELRITFEESL